MSHGLVKVDPPSLALPFSDKFPSLSFPYSQDYLPQTLFLLLFVVRMLVPVWSPPPMLLFTPFNKVVSNMPGPRDPENPYVAPLGRVVAQDCPLSSLSDNPNNHLLLDLGLLVSWLPPLRKHPGPFNCVLYEHECLFLLRFFPSWVSSLWESLSSLSGCVFHFFFLSWVYRKHVVTSSPGPFSFQRQFSF